MPTFKELGIEESILNAIADANFEVPMPIQEKVIPVLLQEKRDIIGLAQTGTGKTAAFGIPIVQQAEASLYEIQYLILSPTRELCLQISDDLASFAKYKPGIRIAAVFGGASIERQIQKISRGVQIVSATPGRLIDLINRGIIDLSKIKTLVLDEADEMLNMGFRDDLEEILRSTPKNKNVLLFSATMPKEIVAIANNYMKDPLEITVGKRNAGAENIEHFCYLVHAKDRYLALKRIVDFNPDIYGIVFCRTRAETQEVADHLIRDGYNADSLHGDLSQNQRDFVMNKFRIKNLQLLVATDVAARGLDVDNLTHIINYNLPEENELYTHRSGRTGRAGKKGVSIVIANLKEKNKLYDIEQKVNKKFTYLDIPSGKDICKKQLFFLIDRMEKVEVDDTEINPLLPEINNKLEWLDRDELIKKFVSVEFNRFVEYYKNTADLNAPTAKGSSKSRSSNYNFTRFFINIGRRDDLAPNILMGLVNDFTGKKDIEIGKIELLKNFSFFEVDSSYADLVLKAFEGQEYRGRSVNLEVAGSQKSEGDRRERSSGRPSGRRDFKKSYGGRDGGSREGGSRDGARRDGRRRDESRGDGDSRGSRFGGERRDRNEKSERYGDKKAGGEKFGRDRKERKSDDGKVRNNFMDKKKSRTRPAKERKERRD